MLEVTVIELTLVNVPLKLGHTNICFPFSTPLMLITE